MKPDLHAPRIAQRNDGTWGVFCHACSDAAQEYVYPCRVLGDVWAREGYPARLRDATLDLGT